MRERERERERDVLTEINNVGSSINGAARAKPVFIKANSHQGIYDSWLTSYTWFCSWFSKKKKHGFVVVRVIMERRATNSSDGTLCSSLV